jgi:hypothetical protein
MFDASVPPDHTFQRRWTARCALLDLLDALDPTSVPEVHPLVDRIELVPTAQGSGGVFLEYLVHEHVPFGPLRFPNTYRVRQETRDGGRRVRMLATAAAGVTLVHDLRMTPGAAEVSVAHRVDVWAPWPVRGWVGATAEAAHDGWVAGIIRFAEARASRVVLGGA